MPELRFGNRRAGVRAKPVLLRLRRRPPLPAVQARPRRRVRRHARGSRPVSSPLLPALVGVVKDLTGAEPPPEALRRVAALLGSPEQAEAALVGAPADVRQTVMSFVMGLGPEVRAAAERAAAADPEGFRDRLRASLDRPFTLRLVQAFLDLSGAPEPRDEIGRAHV